MSEIRTPCIEYELVHVCISYILKLLTSSPLQSTYTHAGAQMSYSYANTARYQKERETKGLKGLNNTITTEHKVNRVLLMQI